MKAMRWMPSDALYSFSRIAHHPRMLIDALAFESISLTTCDGVEQSFFTHTFVLDGLLPHNRLQTTDQSGMEDSGCQDRQIR